MKKTVSIILLVSLALFGTWACKKNTDLSVSSKAELEEKLQAEMENNNLTSISYCVVKNQSLLYSGAMGLADKDKNKPATDSTRYLIASISKTVTAVALMQLVDKNLIALDDDINAQLPFSVRNPRFANDKITYRMLLTHTSSISDRSLNGFELDCYGKDCDMGLDELFKNVFLSNGTYFSNNNFSDKKPGSAEDYSNLASALVGYLVERVAKTPFDVYCKNNIFAPLGMKKTDWRLANTPISELAVPYSRDIKSANPHYTFPDYPNGGLRTNVLDLSAFLRAVMQTGAYNGVQILSQASLSQMKTLQFGSSEQCLSFYYDTVNGKKLLGHNGGEKGVTTSMYFDPASNIGVIVFNNDDDANVDNVVSLLLNYGEKQ